MAKINVYQRELYHHGILGQKWGRKMGPPYPLGAGDHSASEKKEGYKKSLGGGRNESLYDRKDKKASSSKTESKVVMKRKGSDAKSYEKFNNSKEAKAAKKKAYDRTLEYFKEKDPEYLEKITKENGGKTEGLEKFQDFRDKFDAFDVDEWDKAEKEFNKHPLSKREIKKKAKNYENAINQLEKNEMDLQLANWNLDAAKAQAKAKMEKAKKEGNLEKAESYLNDLQIMYKKYNEIQSDYSMNRAAIDNLINKIDSDPDILYTVKNAYSYGGKNLNEYAKVLNDKYGTESNKYYNLGGERSMSGSRFKVTNNTARKSKKKKYSDSKYKKEKQHVRNEAYYYTY